MEAGEVQVGVRAAVHALDAALAEHRRAVTLAAGSRERERMTRARTVKAAAAALEQPVDRPMRGLKLAETWIEVNRVRHPLSEATRARLDGAELRVSGDGWAARVVLPPGEGPAEAARAAEARVAAAATAAEEAARTRLRLVTEAARAEAAAHHDAASVLAAGDRRIAELHADQARAGACATELAERLGSHRSGASPEIEAARARVDQARLYLDATPEQSYAWIDDWPPEVAGAMLRDLPEESRVATEPALRHVVAELRPHEQMLALAVIGDRVAAATNDRVLVAGDEGVVASGHELVVPAAAEGRPGRLAAVADLVGAARREVDPAPAPPSKTAPGDPVDMLRRLGELRDGGVISAVEFEAKKAELLRRI